MKIIARIRTDFGSKFGVPRQSGIACHLEARIVFEPEYRVADALRGLEGYSHLWLIWQFSGVVEDRERQGKSDEWSPTVRPPRLGGNRRMGVFATRSPFRPNPIGLSSVEMIRIDLQSAEGPVIWVRGADLMDGTPIYDIKPYLPFTDSHPEAKGGFTDQTRQQEPLEVVLTQALEQRFANRPDKLEALKEVLADDPRPHYQNDPDRIYGMNFAGEEIHFRIQNNQVICISE